MARFLYALALAALLAPDALAQTCTTSWTNPAGGAWETATNWDAGVPDASDVVCITLDGTYTVSQSSANRTIFGLVVGGASGTQTLTSFNIFTISGDARVSPNGRWEVLNRTPGGTDGVYLDGTLLVEGTLVQNGGTSFLTTGGTLDVAPGGTFQLVTAANAGGAAATFRIRGLLEGAGCPLGTSNGTCNVGALLDVQGGTIRASVGRLDLSGGGTLHDATLDAADGANLWVRRPGTFTVTGTLAGAPVGTVLVLDAVFRAGPGDATLALGGAGLVFSGASGVQFSTISSAGGRFVNTGLLTWGDSFAIASAVVIENRGTLRSLEGVSLDQGARLLNRAGATWEIATSAAMGFGDGTVENYGLIVKTGAGFTNFGTGQGRLRNFPGAEMRVVNGRLDVAVPSSRTLPDGVSVTGTAGVLFPGALEIEGTVSPGTPEQPVATMAVTTSYRVSLIAGSPRLVVDVDAGGASDRLDIAVGSGTANTPRLGGALVVRVRPGFTPAVGDAWTVLTSTRAVLGQFAQVVAENAPPGVAFVAEIPADGLSVVVRAVATAPGGPVTVSTTAPVGGAVRPVFLTGPGAPGVSAARLECTSCLDPTNFGTIPGTLVGSGTLREVRFDLTSPRAFGFYTLVIQRPGQPDEVVPVTVRPYLGFVVTDGGLQRGGRVRPPGNGYNWTHYRMTIRTNTAAPAFALPRVHRDEPRFALALATGNAFVPGVVVLYESDLAADPLRPPPMFGRIVPGSATMLTYGLRINPEHVLFPGETPTGPDDPRIPFGAQRGFGAYGAQHLSAARARDAVGVALRTSGHAGLTAYIAAVDAADPNAVAAAFSLGRVSNRAYFTVPEDVLGELLRGLNATVPTPPGLAAAAGDAFDAALTSVVEAVYVEIEQAHLAATSTAPADVQALFAAEVAALFPEGFPGGGALAGAAARQTPIEDLMCLLGFGESISAIQSIGDGGGGGGGGCGDPEGSADPNDKLAENNLACELGLVVVGGGEEWRCVRYFVPRAAATEPLIYTVRFENLASATAPAELVTITDEIDANLDLTSLEILGTSSDSTFSYSVTGRTVTFRFVGIDLPPNVTAPEGEGFVRFSLRPNAGLPDGTEIRNDASIVFDFNPPIATPEVVHEIRQSADVATTVTAPDFLEVGVPYAFEVDVANLQGDPAEEVTVTITTGVPVATATPTAGTCEGTGPVTCTFGTMDAGTFETVTVVLASPPIGVYTLASEVATTSFDTFAPNDTDAMTVAVVGVGTEDESGFPRELTLSTPRPNPARGAVTLRWGLPHAGWVEARVYDLLGREVARLADGEPAQAGWHEVRWGAAVASGVYVVRLRVGEETRTRRLTVLR